MDRLGASASVALDPAGNWTMEQVRGRFLEWPTLVLLALAYGGWAVALFRLAPLSLWLAVPLAALAAALHSSLTHEAIHGHPTQNDAVNATLLLLPLTLWVPYLRFMDTHLAHHHDEILTDPYDDPESNYLDPKVWVQLPGWWRAVLRFNNRLLGRITIGPAIGMMSFIGADLRLIAGGDRRVLWSWLLHLPPLALVLWIAVLSPMPIWAVLLSAYLATALLKIRTFLEHRAHERASGRTVVVEDRGILALLFLNNCFHVVHHIHPKVPWYDLPALYAERREHYLRRNDGYHYRSYVEVFRQYFWKAKDPVPHPLMKGE